ncbi:EF-hand domain-containing protein [Novosphingobium sp.]|uniref:EF-hand domain-containing protein n=1 Tax=Novosphingobium sp. TaxID=1874826 RepID=UPI0025ECC056|nr:EF-hand domain-containing protein [Novosphingobium sp.]MCC6924465.1 EF-hand domain-containing protein [Novosphingobium sp.]
MKKITLGLSLLALGIAGTAIAAAERGPGMDPLGDKTVTKAEFLASHGDMFAKMDANKDGKLDAADRAAHQGQMQGQMFDKLDTDHNGSISREEFAAAHQRGGDRAGHGQREGKHGEHGGKRGGMMMKMADANKDGAVTRDELQAAAAKHFDMMDANKDGKLTKEERQAARDKMRAMKGGKRGGQGPGPHAGHDMPPPPAN